MARFRASEHPSGYRSVLLLKILEDFVVSNWSPLRHHGVLIDTILTNKVATNPKSRHLPARGRLDSVEWIAWNGTVE